MAESIAMRDFELRQLKDQVDELETKWRMLRYMPMPGWLRDVDNLVLQSRARRGHGGDGGMEGMRKM